MTSGQLLLLDTNLLVLWVVARAGPSYVADHKRLREFSLEDFHLLSGIVKTSRGVVFSPHVLAETSNLCRHASSPRLEQFMLSLKELASAADEQAIPSREACHDEAYVRLGLTDAVLLGLTGGERTLLTADLHLYLEAARRGLPAINFNHLRERAW